MATNFVFKYNYNVFPLNRTQISPTPFLWWKEENNTIIVVYIIAADILKNILIEVPVLSAKPENSF